MPSIHLTDQVGADVEVELNENSAIAKYLKDLSKLKLSKLQFDQPTTFHLQAEIMRIVRANAFVSLVVLALLIPGLARGGGLQGSFSERRIRFARGAHSASLRGQVSRSRAMLYKVGARRGQSMTVRLEGDAKTKFDLSGPKDSSGQAMVSGETEWSGTLTEDGDYKIFVFTEDRVKAPFTITVTIE